MAEIDTFYTTTFQTNWEHGLQQKDTLLLPTVTLTDLIGERKWFNIINPSEMTSITTRKGDTPDGEFDAYKVWLHDYPKEKVTVFDEFDAKYLGQIVLPTSDEVKVHQMAYNRAIDATVRDALGGNRLIGETGSTTDALPSAQKVAKDFVEQGSTANSGLTIGKLRQTSYIMDAERVPASGRYFVATSKQKQDLLRTKEATSSEFAGDIRALVSGTINQFMGFTFVWYEDLSTLESNVRACYAYHKEGVKLVLREKKVHMDYLPNRRHALQIRTVGMMGATRTENEKVVQVACHEAP